MTDARTHLVFLIPLIPGIAAAILGLSWLFGARMHKTTVKIVSCGSVFISFLVSALCVDALFKYPERFYKQELWTWFSTWGTNAREVIHVSFAFDMDPLSAIMILVVTGIGLLIHIYSTVYMGEDEGFQKFMAYLNLFMFSMLILVLGSNFLTMFIGWEGVGLCSYLLIGFWYKDLANAKAAKKAFVTNRVGDFLFITGLFALFWVTGQTTGFYSIEFSEMRLPENIPHYLFTQHNASILGIPLVTFATLMFFGGATGKSAQIPLFVWLPDAMAGPTPVSALIHAATMVTSGLYMITRLNFLFTIAETTLLVIAVIGVLTALMAATIGLFQYDIKKVLAYSTVSQLGYMFLAMGTGAYAAGMFHVFTHAFFKALMFLGSGSVIHSLHHALPHGVDAQDMRNMGGLRKYMPVTFWTFMVGWLAICGIFPFAGFWSKDEILWKTLEQGMNGKPYWYLIYILGLATAGLTAFYMTRQVAMVFFGEYRGRKIGEDYLQKHEGHHADAHAAPAHGHAAHDDHAHADDHAHGGGHGGGAHDDDHHDDHGHVSDPHESPFAITLPLRTLAIGSAIVGFFGVGAWFTHLTSVPNHWNNWLEPVIFTHDEIAAMNKKAFGLNEDGSKLILLAQHGDAHATPAHATDAAHGTAAAPHATAPAHGDSHAKPAHGDAHGKPAAGGHGDSHAAAGGHGEDHGGAHGGAHHAPWYIELLFAVISVVVALGAMRFAWQLYVKQPERPAAMLKAYGPGGAKSRSLPGRLYSLIYDKYRWDELYEATAIGGTRFLSVWSARFDTYVVDGIVNGIGYTVLVIRTIAGILDTYVVDSFAILGSARVVGWVGDKVRGVQSGDLQGYLRWVGYGALAIIGFYVLVFSKEII